MSTPFFKLFNQKCGASGIPDSATCHVGQSEVSHKPNAGDRVKLTGGGKWHSDVEGVVVHVQNGGDVLEILKDGDTIPIRVSVEDYKSVVASPKNSVQPSTQQPVHPKAKGMSVEEARAHLARPGQIMGYDSETLLKAQRDKRTLKAAT